MTAASRPRNELHRRILGWHRRIGLVASILVLGVVVTGLPLNHTESLGLDRKVVAGEVLLDWYGMGPRTGPVSYRVGKKWLSVVGDSLYLEDRVLTETATDLKGAVAVKNFIVVASQGLFLLTDDGTLVEKLSADALPGPVEGVGLSDNGSIVVQTPSGQFSSSVDFRGWTVAREPIVWARPAPLPTEIEAAIRKAYRGGGIPWSRLLLDIHTGRILGAWGPYLIDAAAVALLLLVGTGIYNWFRSNP